MIHAPRGEHSEKPDEVHDIIERALGGKGPFLELFGRKHVDGWKVLGNRLRLLTNLKRWLTDRLVFDRVHLNLR